ncbi:hypothetical protein Hanom_Chr00s017225g01756861 [Helianthus anomalus]
MLNIIILLTKLGIFTYIPLLKGFIKYLPNSQNQLHISPFFMKLLIYPFAIPFLILPPTSQP